MFLLWDFGWSLVISWYAYMEDVDDFLNWFYFILSFKMWFFKSFASMKYHNIELERKLVLLWNILENIFYCNLLL